MTYKTNPRDYALQLVEEGIVSPQKMLLAARRSLWEMSYDEIDVMLECMEMSPRFLEEDDEDDRQPTEQEEWADFDPDC